MLRCVIKKKDMKSSVFFFSFFLINLLECSVDCLGLRCHSFVQISTLKRSPHGGDDFTHQFFIHIIS